MILIKSVVGTGSLCPLSTSVTAFRCEVIFIDEDSVRSGVAEPSWPDSNASLKLPSSASASASKTTRPSVRCLGHDFGRYSC